MQKGSERQFANPLTKRMRRSKRDALQVCRHGPGSRNVKGINSGRTHPGQPGRPLAHSALLRKPNPFPPASNTPEPPRRRRRNRHTAPYGEGSEEEPTSSNTKPSTFLEERGYGSSSYRGTVLSCLCLGPDLSFGFCTLSRVVKPAPHATQVWQHYNTLYESPVICTSVYTRHHSTTCTTTPPLAFSEGQWAAHQGPISRSDRTPAQHVWWSNRCA